MDIDENHKQKDQNGEGGQDGEGSQAKLDDMIKDLSTSLWGVKNEQEYMQVLIRVCVYIITEKNIRLSNRSL